MKVSLSWLKELVNFDISSTELSSKLSIYSIGIKEQTRDCLELDLTYNRGDLLSMRGVAREVAAVTDSKLLFSAENLPDYDLPETPVEIEDENLCPVYCLAKIEGLSVKPSPEEWAKKLKDSGIRSVNNIADITNLIMIEYGQPLHAFDQQKIKGDVKVRVAKKGEKIITLDGKDRNLDEKDLLITDDAGPIAVAGVMGGKDSEVTENTQSILLEAAIFNPISNRKTSKRHGLYSEASKRFQHGLTKTNLLQASSAAIKMYQDLGGKVTAIKLVGNLKDEIKTIKLSQEKINSLIGIEIPSEAAESSLKKLSFTINSSWEVTVPYFRLDINIEEDLIEEIARMYGYERIKPKELSNKVPPKLDQTVQKNLYSLKKKLADIGLTEVQTYSFYSTKILSALRLPLDALIKIANPISSETEYMRNNLWPNLLEAVAKNIRNGIKDVAIFEIGKVYLPKVGDLPKETYHLSIALSNGTDNPIQELNQIAKNLKLKPNAEIEKEYSHPVRRTDGMAEIHPRYINKFGIEARVAVLEIELNN
ncbi:phenylalanine--tRNA ligase subunit beta [Patescibacteria group bacterium]|nr:phenylalanine--tRNA ligase subunit beta [Patescibacteria group bacterium]